LKKRLEHILSNGFGFTCDGKSIIPTCTRNTWPDEKGAEQRKTGKEVPTIVSEFMLNFKNIF